MFNSWRPIVGTGSSARISLVLLFLALTIRGDRTLAQQPPDSKADEPAARTAAPEWATLVGSAERNKYHRLACGLARQIKAENTIWFIDANDATENGYVAAGCNDRKCRPPAADSSVVAGPIGGAVFAPPDLNPPEIPKPAAAPQVASNTNTNTNTKRQPNATMRAVNPPPPRAAPRRNVAANQTWQGVPPARELDARKKWDVWAAWALDRWCERWHVTSSGKIAPNTAYSPNAERQLMATFNEIKDAIDQNKKRMKELESAAAGKKK